VSEAAGATRRSFEVRDNLEFNLHDRDDYELRDTLAWFQSEGLMTAIPARDHELALVIRIDQPDEIAEHDAVSVSQPRARQNHCRQCRVLKIDRKTRRYELRTTGRKLERLIETSPEIEPG
jgi:hypothetical protein